MNLPIYYFALSPDRKRSELLQLKYVLEKRVRHYTKELVTLPGLAHPKTSRDYEAIEGVKRIITEAKTELKDLRKELRAVEKTLVSMGYRKEGNTYNYRG